MQNLPSDELARLSRLMKWLCVTALAALLATAFYIGVRLLAEGGPFLATIAPISFDPTLVKRWQIAGIMTVNGIGVWLLSLALLSLRDMFSQFALGNVLSSAPARSMRSAGRYFLVGAAWSILAHSVTVLLATASNAPGERALAISFSSQQLFPLLLAGTLFAVGHLLSEAIRLDQENKSFV
ncbi:MAG: hypothetical protein AAFP80_00295 [Pseudomonadota bacterium]